MGTVDILDHQDMKSSQSAFMDIQQQAAAAGLSAMSHHQSPYSTLRSTYGGPTNHQTTHDAFGSQQRSSLAGAYPFATMNNSPLHNSYSHPATGHPYLGSYAPPPPNVTPCAPCPPSPPRDNKIESSKCQSI